MKRAHFLVLAGVVATFFGLSMIAAPDQLLKNMTTMPSESAERVLQWMGVTLLALGAINILSRNDAGSPALRAVLIGNIVLHVLGFGIDVWHHMVGFVNISGVITGGVVHLGLIAGFAFYLSKLPASTR